MTEPNERISALEANMSNVLAILSKREEFQNNVLVKLTTIELKQDQSLLYQKTCDAERTAHGTRIGMLENTVTTMAETIKSIEGLATRLLTVERHIAKGDTVWWTLLKIAGTVSFLVSMCAGAVEIWRWFHP